jgi:ABC-type Co2+ transport system permease subunit
VTLIFLDDLGRLTLGHHLMILGTTAVASLIVAAVELRLENAPEFPLGLLVGVLAVLATVGLNALVLLAAGQRLQSGPQVLALAEQIGLPPPTESGPPADPWRLLVVLLFVVHLPIAALEGIILGFTVGFLARVKPSLLRWHRPPVARTPAPPAPLVDVRG